MRFSFPSNAFLRHMPHNPRSPRKSPHPPGTSVQTPGQSLQTRRANGKHKPHIPRKQAAKTTNRRHATHTISLHRHLPPQKHTTDMLKAFYFHKHGPA